MEPENTMYTIFTIDFENNPFRMNVFMNYVSSLVNDLKGNVLPMVGCYKGKKEHCFICRTDDFNHHFRHSAYIAGQESILHVAGGNKMETVLEYLDGTTPSKGLGCMHAVCREEAMEADNWTYCPQRKAYWIAKVGNPDNSLKESREKYADKYIKVRPYLDIILHPLPSWVTTRSLSVLRDLNQQHGRDYVTEILFKYFEEMGDNGQNDSFNKHNNTRAVQQTPQIVKAVIPEGNPIEYDAPVFDRTESGRRYSEYAK